MPVIPHGPAPDAPDLPNVTPLPAALSRAAFLRGALAAAISAAAGPRLLAGVAEAAESAAATVSPALSPLDLRFSIEEQFRPFDLLPRRFVQVSERFDGAGADRYAAAEALQAEGQPARAGRVGQALRLKSAAAAPTLFRTNAGPVAPYATVIVSVGTAPQGSGGEAAVVAGLVRDARNYVVATFDAGADATHGTVSIDVVAGGKRTRAASAAADLTGPARFAFVVNENYVTALLGDATSWRPVVQYRVTDLVDLRDPAVLREYRYGFGAAGADATVDITGLEAGYFGAGRAARPARGDLPRRHAASPRQQALLHRHPGRPGFFQAGALGRVDPRPRRPAPSSSRSPTCSSPRRPRARRPRRPDRGRRPTTAGFTC